MIQVDSFIQIDYHVLGCSEVGGEVGDVAKVGSSIIPVYVYMRLHIQ